MPSNCSNDVQEVIAHFDAVADDPAAVATLKTQFGMEDVAHYDDVTGACEYLVESLTSVLPLNIGDSKGTFVYMARDATLRRRQ